MMSPELVAALIALVPAFLSIAALVVSVRQRSAIAAEEARIDEAELAQAHETQMVASAIAAADAWRRDNEELRKVINEARVEISECHRHRSVLEEEVAALRKRVDELEAKAGGL